MIRLLSLFIISFYCFQGCFFERRIVLGKRTTSEKPYVVYLVKSNMSEMNLYDTWMCSGAIVSSRHILTSAACLYEVSHLYAIAGYKKYLRYEYLEDHECTRNRKQRVVKTCLPYLYNFSHSETALWLNLDIGLAIVEKPYDFKDTSYRIDCHYTPRPIRINFNVLRPETNFIDAVVYGWGHTQGLRLPGDIGDYNTEYMHEAQTIVQPSTVCLESYKDPKLEVLISKYMLCCSGFGELNADGNTDFAMASRSEYCNKQFQINRRQYDPDCGDDYFDGLRRSNKNNSTLNISRVITQKRRGNFMKRTHNKTEKLNKRKSYNKTKYDNIRLPRSRRQGICQNDHGSPLVTWLGSEEVVIGVGATSLYDKFYLCSGPFLYTSTSCVSRFLKCALAYDNSTRRSCDNMEKEEGYEMREYTVPWGDFENVTEGESSSDTVSIARNNITNITETPSSLTTKFTNTLASITIINSTFPDDTKLLPAKSFRLITSPFLSLLTTKSSSIFENQKIEDENDERVMSVEVNNKNEHMNNVIKELLDDKSKEKVLDRFIYIIDDKTLDRINDKVLVKTDEKVLDTIDGYDAATEDVVII